MAERVTDASPTMSIVQPHHTHVWEALSPRAILSAIVLGCAICFANMYFGLQAGTVNAMPMQTALLAFAFFRSIQHRLSSPLSPEETTAVEMVAGAVGLAPFTAGYTGLIPALEFLTTPKENGPKRFSIPRLLVWSIAICCLGIVFAAPFRRLFILAERLRYPSATATGTLIGVLFGRGTIVARAELTDFQYPKAHGLEADASPESRPTALRKDVIRADSEILGDAGANMEPEAVGHAVKILLVSLGGSTTFSLVSYFMPILRNMPIFGSGVATQWLWAFDLSPAYFGYGFIIGPSVNLTTLLGAIIGWGILSPVAKKNGWAPGPVDNWDSGSRGWIVFVGMGLILGDSAIGLTWVICKPLASWIKRQLKAQRSHGLRDDRPSEQASLLDDRLGIHREGDTIDIAIDDDWPSNTLVTRHVVLYTSLIFLILYLVSFLAVFRNLVPPVASLVALLLIPLAGFISMRSLGETDNGAALAIGRVAQFIIGSFIPASNSNRIFANLLLSGVVEAGASQASQQMGGLKTAYMTKTPPRAIFFGQMIGSIFGTLIATLVYRIYTSAGKIPSTEFGIPDGRLWLVAARLVYQQGLPPQAFKFAIGAFAFGAALSILRILALKRWWKDFLPSGIAMAIGKPEHARSPLSADAD
ncbi:MAG: hypothetical protein Q9170_005088 [Blastenia crenularia]